MQQLSGLDAGFLYMETPSVHMHTLKVAVIDPIEVGGGYSVEKFRDILDRHRKGILVPKNHDLLIHNGVNHPVVPDPEPAQACEGSLQHRMRIRGLA